MRAKLVVAAVVLAAMVGGEVGVAEPLAGASRTPPAASDPVDDDDEAEGEAPGENRSDDDEDGAGGGGELSEVAQRAVDAGKYGANLYLSYDNIARVLVFNGIDGWSGGAFAHSGLVWAPSGLDAPGLVVKVMGGVGTYRYKSGTRDIVGAQYLASLLPGWHFKADRVDITVFAGLDLQHHQLFPDDPGNALRGSRAGLRVGADLWTEPVRDMMAAASVSFATIGASYWTRGALGWRVFDRFYLGPEVHAMGDDVYRQWRVGAHVTALRTGPWEWSAGLGYVADSSARDGVYGRIGLLKRL